MSLLPTSPDRMEEADRALSDFFKGQLPTAWPACRATSAVVPVAQAPTSDVDSSWSSRAALVASVVLLLGLGFYFASGLGATPTPQAGKPGTMLNGATANGTGLLKSAAPAGKHEDPMKDFPKSTMP